MIIRRGYIITHMIKVAKISYQSKVFDKSSSYRVQHIKTSKRISDFVYLIFLNITKYKRYAAGTANMLPIVSAKWKSLI